jgi:hypothetical protein
MSTCDVWLGAQKSDKTGGPPSNLRGWESEVTERNFTGYLASVRESGFMEGARTRRKNAVLTITRPIAVEPGRTEWARRDQ